MKAVWLLELFWYLKLHKKRAYKPGQKLKCFLSLYNKANAKLDISPLPICSILMLCLSINLLLRQFYTRGCR